MNADPRVPFTGTLSSSPASRRARASTQTRSRGNSTTPASATLPHQRRSSLQIQAQQHGAQPHQADSPDCLCTACHLRAAVFPRRQDGRIVLPILWRSPSNPAGEVSRGAPQLPGEMENHVPNVAETTRSDAYARHNWGRKSEGSSIRTERHTDRGEGSSRGVPRLSGPGIAPGEELRSVQPGHSNISDNVEGKRRRSNADRSKSYRYPKPYHRLPEQGTSTPQPVGLGHSESNYRPGIDPSSVYLRHPSSLVTSQPSFTGMESRRDQYGTTNAGPSQSLEPRAQLVNPNLNPSTSSTVHSHLFSQESDRGLTALPTSTRGSHPRLHPPTSPLDRRPAQSVPWRNEGRKSPHPQPSGSSDTHFNTRSQSSIPENSQKASSHAVPAVDPSRQTSFPAPTSAPSSSSFTWRPGDDEENVIRFQEPVVHDPTIVSDQQDGQIEIKWDTERKRRQGYFSQAEEGSEKSNFRLYNQSEIDFGS